MDIKYLKSLTLLCAILLSVSAVIDAAPNNYYWNQEYTGSEPGTIALWNFNSDEITTTEDGELASVEGVNSAWTISALTTSAAEFVSGGKFGGGLANYGGTAAANIATVTSSTNLFPSGSDPSLSIELWVKFNSASDNQFFIDKMGNSKGAYHLRALGSNLYFRVSDGSVVFGAVTSGLTWTNGQWYHIAATWNAEDDTARIYRDGILLVSEEHTGKTIVDSTNRFVTVTNYGLTTHRALNGTMDGLRIGDIPYVYGVIPELCGDFGTVYLRGDISGPDGVPDCRVDMYDLAAVLVKWLECTDPADPTCYNYWD